MQTSDVLISPNFQSSSFGGNPSIDEKILIFEDRINGWFLEVAQELLNKINESEGFPRSYFAVLAILALYFEMIGQYASGQSSQNMSKRIFRQGMEEVFGDEFAPNQRTEIYKSLRCALYHNGLTKGAIVGKLHIEPIYFDHGYIFINPHSLLEKLKEHFEFFIETLKNPDQTQARKNFVSIYDSNSKL